MAVKDHSLDEKLIRAAKEEFMLRGYQKASLQQIVSRAGITTGALYTRYKNKDALFCSLVQEVFDAAAEKAGQIGEQYMAAQISGNPRQILNIIRQEEKIYQDLLFSHYDACVLFYCKSAGSSVETKLNRMMEMKMEQTVAYFKSIARTDLDLDGIGMLIANQFHFFRQILEAGYTREKAMRCMQVVDLYQEAGWEALFKAIL